MFLLWFERRVPAYARQFFDGRADYVDGDWLSQDHLAELAGADAVIASARLRYDAALMERAPRLRVISRTGVGYDNVDVGAATERGIMVCNTPDAVTRSTAEHAIALILAVAKDLKRISTAMADEPGDYLNRHRAIEVQGRRLGLVGAGRIGSEVGRIASCLGMTVIAFDPALTPERAAALGILRAESLRHLLEESDIVSLHIPYSPENRHIIGPEQFAWMRTGALLVNCSRGGIVDETALIQALDSGKLMGAATDVLATEPPPKDHPLLRRNDVLVTPHIAAATDAGLARLWETAITQALQVLAGEKPPHLVDQEAWPRRRGARA